jgi:SAM-dependent methyltransferase
VAAGGKVTSASKNPLPHSAALAWQREVWDKAAKVYLEGVEPRFAPIVKGMFRRAKLRSGERVLDLGCGPGAVTLRTADAVGPSGRVDAVDISDEMLRLARARVADRGLGNVTFHNAGAEALPLPQHSADAVLAGLSLMFVPDRAAAAREIARVLRPGGRLVATFPTGADTCDLVKFQRILGSFAPEPPVKGVGPGSMADPRPFLRNLAESGIEATVEQEECDFEFANLDEAWDIFAHVTAMRMSPERREAARAEVQRQMWPEGDGPRRFTNLIQFLVGTRA